MFQGVGHRLRGSANAVRVRAPQIGGEEVYPCNCKSSVHLTYVQEFEFISPFLSVNLFVYILVKFHCLTVKAHSQPDILTLTGLSLLFLQEALLYGVGSSPQSTVG